MIQNQLHKILPVFPLRQSNTASASMVNQLNDPSKKYKTKKLGFCSGFFLFVFSFVSPLE